MGIDAYGAPINAVGTFREVTGLDTPSTDIDGMRTGFKRVHKGREFILLKAAGTIADGLVVMKDTTSGQEITVVVTTGTAVAALGINNTGVSITSGQYFWALWEGLGYGDPEAGGFVDSDKIGPAANGEIDVVGTVGTVIGVALLDSSATVNANRVFFSFGAGFVAAS